jgi:predicted RNase H-like HicB family nuclease
MRNSLFAEASRLFLLSGGLPRLLALRRCGAYTFLSDNGGTPMTTIAKTKIAGRKTRPASAKPRQRPATPKRYTVSDGTLLLNLEVEGKWFVVTSPLDPELVTQARTIEEAFRMAYDAKALLEEYRAELAKEVKARRTHTGA